MKYVVGKPSILTAILLSTFYSLLGVAIYIFTPWEGMNYAGIVIIFLSIFVIFPEAACSELMWEIDTQTLKFTNYSKGIDKMQSLLNIQLKNRTCFGLYVHICCLIERLVTHKSIEIYSNRNFLEEEPLFIECVKKSFSDVEKFYNVEIPIEEIGYIYDYVKNN